MKRKIIRIADRTSAITIPKDWIDKNNIDKGSYIEIQEINNSLIIKNPNNFIKRTELNVSDLNEDLIWRHLITSYRKGIDELIIRFKTDEESIAVEKFAKDLIGWIIVEFNNSNIHIKELVSNENYNIDELLEKTFLLVMDISSLTLEDIKNRDIKALKVIRHRDLTINRYINLSLRLLNKYGYHNYEKTNSLYKIFSLLEEIGDEYNKIALIYRKNPVILNKKILDCFNDLNLLIKEYHELFYNFNNEKLIKIHLDAELLKEKLINLKDKENASGEIISGLKTILHLIKSSIEENMVLSL